LLLPFFIIHIEYVKPALTKALTVNDCGGPQFAEVPRQVPIVPCPNSGTD